MGLWYDTCWMLKLVIKVNSSNDFMEDFKTKWVFLKYKIWKFITFYWKSTAKLRKQSRFNLKLKETRTAAVDLQHLKVEVAD